LSIDLTGLKLNVVQSCQFCRGKSLDFSIFHHSHYKSSKSTNRNIVHGYMKSIYIIQRCLASTIKI